MKLTTKFIKHTTGTLLSFGLITSPAHAVVLVTQTNDANTLANSILGPGFTLVNATYTGALQASGTFSGGNSAGIGIDNGIILTNGKATDAAGPNNSGTRGSSNLIFGSSGDTQLDNVVSGVTRDATSLNINFTTEGGDLYLNYVFGSEEYNNPVPFNDGIGFFLDGQNIALVPGTTTPVSVNNINNVNNSNYYINNPPNSPGLQYDGFTTGLTAQYLGLTPGTHNIKLVIADTNDSAVDSGVFIQAGSFANQPVPIPFEFSPGLMILALGAATGIAQLRSKVKKNSLEVLPLTTNDRQA